MISSDNILNTKFCDETFQETFIEKYKDTCNSYSCTKNFLKTYIKKNIPMKE